MPNEKCELVINGQMYQVPMSEILGLQVRALAAIAPSFQLIVEGIGSEPDRVLLDEEVVSLKGKVVRIFSRPPTAFGSPVLGG